MDFILLVFESVMFEVDSDDEGFQIIDFLSTFDLEVD